MTVKNHSKLFIILLAIGLFFVIESNLYSRPGGGRGGRGGRSGGRRGGRSSGRHSRSPRAGYGSVRHSGSSARGRMSGGMVGRPQRSARLAIAGHHNGRPYYSGLPGGYRRVVIGNQVRYLYDNIYYKRVYHSGRYVYIASDN